MIEVAVSDENFRDGQVMLLSHFDDAIHIPGGVDNRRLTAVRIADEVDISPLAPAQLVSNKLMSSRK